MLRNLFFILILLVGNAAGYSAQGVDFDAAESAIDADFVNLGKCKVFLKNNNVLEGTVRMRLNFPVYGKNFVNGKFFIQNGYPKSEVQLSEVDEIRLYQVLYPFRGKIMIKCTDGKEYPLKFFIVSREPVQIASQAGGVINLMLNSVKYFKIIR